MGTNYYLRKICPCCGNAEDELHIGLKSAGWEFLWQGYNDETLGIHIRSRKEWTEKIKQALADGWVIQDEYGNTIEVDRFMQKANASGKRHTADPEFAEGYSWHGYFRDSDDCALVFEDFS